MNQTASITRSRQRFYIVGILAIMLGATALIGSLRIPTARLDIPPTAIVQRFAGHTLRIATYNIHSGVGADDRFDLSRTAADLKDFDLVGLNEVRGAFSAGQDQASELGRILAVNALFAPTENRWFHGHFGNALLHRPDLDGYHRIPLAGSLGRGKRNVIQTRILTPGKPISVLVTHIDRGADRAAQLQTVRQMFTALPEPAILMGDMNSEKTDPLIAPLRTSPGVTDGIAQILGDKDPADRIDYIFTRGLKWRTGGLRDSKASDHPMVWAELDSPLR
ncbi:MAG: endonuclease/exonuclease/phosphatase family protein [Tepidisphaerales bacterium]